MGSCLQSEGGPLELYGHPGNSFSVGLQGMLSQDGDGVWV